MSFHEHYGYLLEKKLHKDFETINEPRFSLFVVCLDPIIFLVDCNTKKKTIRVSHDEVSAKVRHSSLLSLNVFTRDVSIPVRYSLRTITP